MPNSPIQPSIPPTPPPVPPVIPPRPPIILPRPQKKSLAWLIIPLLILILPISGYFVFQINKFKQQLNQPPPAVSPSPVAALPSPSPSLTADWQIYTNQVQNYSFQYPSDWQINEAGATFDINNKLTLAKDNYIITIYANIQGIGGGTKKVPSVPITVAGLNLFKRDIGDNLYDNTGSFEISATDSNPTFKYQDKTYEIYLTFPLAEKGTEPYLANLQTFDLILSTFKFIDNTSDIEQVRTTVINYLVSKGHDKTKLKLNEIILFGNYTDKYTVSWVPGADYIGGGMFLLIGKVDSKWVIPESGDTTYCNWVNNSGVDEATIAFMGPTCK